MLSARPKITELVFQLYGRSLHPELFQTFAVRTVKRGDYEARLEITSAGHIVTWNYAGLTLTEVATTASHPLPQRRRLMSSKLKGEKSDSIECRGGPEYHVTFSLERYEPEIFWTFQQELSQDSVQSGLIHHFESSGRMALGAMSYINVETRDTVMRVQAFHTFPDDYAIVKSQSLFKLPSKEKSG